MKRLSRTRAFTLVEVLAAMVLLGIVLPIAMRGVSVALSAAQTARHTSLAASLAESKLNELVALGEITNGTGDFGTDWPGYSWKTVATARDFNTTEFAITVTWQQRGRERSLVVSTLVADTTETSTP